MRKANVRNTGGKWFVDLLEIENDVFVTYHRAVAVENKQEGDVVAHHFLNEYSGFDPIGDWED